MGFSNWHRVAALFAMLGVAACQTPTRQQDSDAEDIYRSTCLLCHAGSGSAAMNSDLTRIAAQNGGVFPTDHVRSIIDGSAGIRAHGSPMPVWSERYSPEQVQDLTAYIAAIQR